MRRYSIVTEEPWFYYGVRKGITILQYILKAEDPEEARAIVTEQLYPKQEIVDIIEVPDHTPIGITSKSVKGVSLSWELALN